MNHPADFQTPPQIIFSDESILIINKPAGLLSVRDGYDQSLPYLSSILEKDWGRLWMVHRLDRETSGLMVLARDPESHRELNRQFRDHLVTKRYHAVVQPVPAWEEITTDAPLLVNADRRHRTRVSATRGKPAKTVFKVISKAEQTAMIECQIFTGFRHQIRAHLYALGLAILGDSLYQPSQLEAPTIPARILLHACQLGFSHPTTEKKLLFNLPDPADFADFN